MNIKEIKANKEKFLGQKNSGFTEFKCQEKSLARKAKGLLRRTLIISDSTELIKDTDSISFSNVKPESKAYDVITINRGKEEVYRIIPRSGNKETKGRSLVYSKDDKFAKPVITGSWKEVKKYFAK